MPDIVIDARSMLPPEPLERALNALDLLGSDDQLTLILNKKPYPLLTILYSNGYRWDEHSSDDGSLKYLISKR